MRIAAYRIIGTTLTRKGNHDHKNADKVFITTAEGTVNTLTNVTGFEADEESNLDNRYGFIRQAP